MKTIYIERLEVSYNLILLMAKVASIKRITKEYTTINEKPVEGCSVEMYDEENVYKWKATIKGPEDTPYEGGVFNVDLEFPSDYPFKPPKVIFTTKVYHPNINTDGNVCMAILKDQWAPSKSISVVLANLSLLFETPNADDPLRPEIAQIFKDDYDAFRKTAIEWTSTYAK